MEAAEQEPVMFDDVAVYFTPEEWGSLEEWQKELYKEVMVENYRALCSLGIPTVKSELLLLIESGEEPCVQGQPRWEKLGCEPSAAPDGRSQRWEDLMSGRIWRDQRPLTYGRRVVRTRCGRRSPNFSRVELERFVSLMDRYLPDKLQRAGVISLRQRRSILQEIARRLEPMSGCLRTPRQLLHRWADFNNRDPERLMDIRMQLHYAASDDRRWGSDTAPPGAASDDRRWGSDTAPPGGGRWRRRTSHHLSSSSSSSLEETPGDPPAVWDEGLSESSAQYSPPPHTSPTTHMDTQGRYIVPPPLPDPGLRMIKSEPDSEEDEGGGWSSDVSSPESVMFREKYRSAGEGRGWPSPDPASPEDSSLLAEQIDRDCQGAGAIRRSPNFSPAELECFVALMDHFLPDNLIRAGAIPIRQRKAILQEIARRLEPLSGCLRTPRQLRHRWTDFNNRDPDRLEEIRSRLRRGNKWRHRRSHRPQRDIKKEVEPPEEQRPTTPWHHHRLPKRRNSFSMARLKRNGQLALHIVRTERSPRCAEQERPLQRDHPRGDS